MAPSAITTAILGLDTAAGAYLARLLEARGYILRGTGDTRLLARLGVSDTVTASDDVARAIAGVDEIYDLRGDRVATAALLDRGSAARIFVAVAPDDAAAIAAVATVRDAGRFVATGRLYPHESRLGPGTSPVARIVAAVAAGAEPDADDLASATDCGWTAEYVDAMWRMLQRPAPEDLAIATGRVLTGSDVARVAARWFGRTAPLPVGATREAVGDPAPARAALGWHAITVGDDLVKVLCEGSGSA